ncbi:glycosyltransferase family 2 protein [Oceanospirillum sediminis]|uniref:Glycosyltransferase family 2 protein n=1 Tax=Oceanospirillum sediminis TaxID=2760088 RepID=A0A839IS16_9GAMM|nr:glycosyltransferase family 2 protein [Oceanospirillum sediminis]MBB1487342.1 glycosyltransferase family 2 protein [Oceanospirillum sediminis]
MDIFYTELSPLMVIAGSIFLIALGLIAYHHFAYPLLVSRLARRKILRNQPVAPILYPLDKNAHNWPAVTIVIPVYNEQAHIAEKIRNLALLDYPSDKLEILMIFDGCTDHSYLLAKDTLAEPLCQSLNCTLFDDPMNRGKLQQLNHHIPNCKTDIVALSDLSALIAMDSLKLAALWFDKKSTGVVCGTYRFFNHAGQQEQSYWQYQCAIKQSESALGSTPGAHGAFYLIRKNLFRPMPVDTINDDFYLPCDVIRQGYKVIYDPRIVALELESSSLEYDFKRRIRISAGNMQQSLRLMDLLKPAYGTTAWMFFSCKWLRPFIPWCFVACMLSSIVLSLLNPWFMIILSGQILGYGLVLAQQVLKMNNAILVKMHYLITGHYFGLLGGIYYLQGRFSNNWKKI